jgi:hypothetical protein
MHAAQFDELTKTVTRLKALFQSEITNTTDGFPNVGLTDYPPLIGGTMASSSPVFTTVDASASTAT